MMANNIQLTKQESDRKPIILKFIESTHIGNGVL